MRGHNFEQTIYIISWRWHSWWELDVWTIQINGRIGGIKGMSPGSPPFALPRLPTFFFPFSPNAEHGSRLNSLIFVRPHPFKNFRPPLNRSTASLQKFSSALYPFDCIRSKMFVSRISVWLHPFKHIGIRAGGRGGLQPPKFWATQIFWAARENLGKASF